MKKVNALAILGVTAITLLLSKSAFAQEQKETTLFKFGPVTILLDNTDPNHPVTKAKLDCGKKIEVTGKVCLTAQDKTNGVTAEDKYEKEIKKLFSCDDPEKCELLIRHAGATDREKKCEGGKEWEAKLKIECKKRTVH